MQHKIIIRRHRPWLRPALIAGCTGALALGAWALYSYTRATTVSDFERAQTEAEQLRAERRQLTRDLRAARAEITQLQQQVVYAQRSTEIDSQACDAVRKSLTDLQAEASELREQVAFYRGIAAPDQARAGVRVQELKLSEIAGRRGRYRFFLTLIQSVRHEKRIGGRIELAIVGSAAGVERKLPLNELAPELAQNLLFSLKYFEEFSGEFQLPAGFVPSRMLVTLVPSSDGAPRTEEGFDWQRVMDNGEDLHEVRE
ncbi:DUF6776 family protein [Solimonas variicoloris]|uniref:DUF6776 family protein n=1 Tax=Solimonas variicoloris TaxID=254408 RepID=UPI000379451D|nr:DUF6776 family protein [Solimonas variicoloris]